MTCLFFALKLVIILLSEKADDSISRGLILPSNWLFTHSIFDIFIFIILFFLYFFEVTSQGSSENVNAGNCLHVSFFLRISPIIYTTCLPLSIHPKTPFQKDQSLLGVSIMDSFLSFFLFL